MLRESYDNDKHWRDYGCPDTVSGKVKFYFNTFFGGTPKQIRKFYPDVENGLVLRHPYRSVWKTNVGWKKQNAQGMTEVGRRRDRVDVVSVLGDNVQPEYLLEFGFLNTAKVI